MLLRTITFRQIRRKVMAKTTPMRLRMRSAEKNREVCTQCGTYFRKKIEG